MHIRLYSPSRLLKSLQQQLSEDADVFDPTDRGFDDDLAQAVTAAPSAAGECIGKATAVGLRS